MSILLIKLKAAGEKINTDVDSDIKTYKAKGKDYFRPSNVYTADELNYIRLLEEYCSKHD